MKLVKQLESVRRIFLDTAPVIYFNDIDLKRVTEIPIIVLSEEE